MRRDFYDWASRNCPKVEWRNGAWTTQELVEWAYRRGAADYIEAAWRKPGTKTRGQRLTARRDGKPVAVASLRDFLPPSLEETEKPHTPNGEGAST